MKFPRSALALLGWLFAARAASAAELGVVVLDHSPPAAPGTAWPEAEQRTRAELEDVGLSVIDVEVSDRSPANPASELGKLARQHRAVAAVRLIRYEKPPGVDIWVADEVTGKTSLRHVATGQLPTSEAVAVVALAVVELLNASLLELRAAHPPRGSAPPSRAVLHLVDDHLVPPAAPYRFALRAGAVALGSPGGLGVMAGPMLAAGWGLHPHWALEAELLATAARSRLDSEAGEAHVGLGIGRLLLAYRGSSDAWVQPLFGIGAGVLFAWVTGDAGPGYRATTDATAVFLPSAVAAAAARLGASLRLRLALGAGFALPELSTRLAGESIASAGRPLVDATVGLEWALSEL